MISIHKALAGLDCWEEVVSYEYIYFNPQGPRGPRRFTDIHGGTHRIISIHKALAGLDITFKLFTEGVVQFQSTRPSRASTHIFKRFRQEA